MQFAQSHAGVSESFAEWESLLSESYVPLLVDPTGEDAFHGRIERSSQPGFELSTVSASAQRIRRTRRGIAKTDGEFLLVSILTEGSGLLYQDDRVALVRPGEMVFYDTSRPYHWDLRGSWAQVVVQTPLEVLRRQLGSDCFPLPTAVTVSADSAGGVVMRLLSRFGPHSAERPWSRGRAGRQRGQTARVRGPTGLGGNPVG